MKFKMGASVAALLAVAASAQAAPSVLNGGFESSIYSSSVEFGQYPGFTNGVTNWTSALAPSGNGFNVYWFPADVAAGYSAPNRFGDPGDKLPLSVTASPNGGNFVALDGDVNYNGYLYQTINGLTAGQSYKVSFYWAGAQLLNRTGDTTDSLAVTLGSAPGVGETHTVGPIAVATHGFSGWINESLTFTATSASEILSFLSIGAPAGLPPVVLLDGVSIDVPEPSNLALLGLGIGAICLVGRRKNLRQA